MRTPDLATAGLHGPVRRVTGRTFTLEPDGSEKVDHSHLDEYDMTPRAASSKNARRFSPGSKTR
jgi:hypothetical protein